MIKYLFIFISMIVFVISTMVAKNCFDYKDKKGKLLGHILLSASLVNLSYVVSIISENYFITSFSSSIYFSLYDFMILYLVHFTIEFTGYQPSKKFKTVIRLLEGFAIIDIVTLMTNPFHEFLISYHETLNPSMPWTYNKSHLFSVHLYFAYLLIAISLFLIIRKAIKTPKVYCKKYLFIIIGILFIVGINGLFILTINTELLDWSNIANSLIGLLIYYDTYHYSETGMLDSARELILNEIGHPVVLFDNEDHLALCNKEGSFLIPEKLRNSSYMLEDFIKDNHMDFKLLKNQKTTYFQWNDIKNKKVYRCDAHVMEDKKNRIISRMFVFTDNSLDIDVITGFVTQSRFSINVENKMYSFTYPVAVAVCDLNKLAYINEKYSKETGDLAIKALSDAIRHNTPEGTLYVRLHEANLMFAVNDCDNNQIHQYIKEIKDELNTRTDFPVTLDIQSAAAIATIENPSLQKAGKQSLKSIKNKKLLDDTSSHSSLLNSLAQVQMENDNCTEAHVQRTRRMGELLGIRLGLSDDQISDLSLLCLLHDIGKLGIPLDILNKPGKLTDAEWDVLKSHTIMGYRIAKASEELEGIADYILHHHESWNGKGYPDQLSHEAIPLLSRIISVVDAYDAMTNDRPYRKAMPKTSAREELKRCAGTQFDPTIVAEFLQLLDEVDPIDSFEDIKDDEVKPMSINEDTTINKRVFPVLYSKYTANLSYEIIDVDDNFYELTGYEKKDLNIYHLGQLDLIPVEDHGEYLSNIVDMFDHPKQQLYLEHRLIRKDHSIRYVFCFGNMRYDSALREQVIDVLISDVASSKAVKDILIEEKNSVNRNISILTDLLRLDPLTNIYNKEAFRNNVEKELLNNKRNIFMMLDLDDFKRFNDTLGHHAGDDLLKLTSRALKEAVKGNGFAGRMGGDEFGICVTISDLYGEKEIKGVVQYVFNYIMNSLSSAYKDVTISLGAVVIEQNSLSYNEAYEKADRALYQAKESGRAQWMFYNEQ